MFVRFLICLCLSVGLCLPALSFAQESNIIVINNHKFSPSPLIIPANQKIQITVDNQDSTPEEFESFDLDREQVVEGNKKIIVFIGPLTPGTYNYWADYHQDSKGVIIAK